MPNKPALISRLLPHFGAWWDQFIGSPWLLGVALLFVVLSAQRHGELSYGSNRASVMGWLVMVLFFAGHLPGNISVTNLGLLGLLLLIMLSDAIVSSLSHGRSPVFVFNIGFFLGLLLFIHPATVVLLPFYLAKLRSIKSSSGRHVTAFLLGAITVVLLATMLFAQRSLVGVQAYLLGHFSPIAQLKWPQVDELPLLAVDLLYLLIISIACHQSMKSSVVRVRGAMSYHIQLAWILMALHLLYGVQGEGQHTFILGLLFVGGIISVHFTTEKPTRRVLLPLTIITIALLGIRAWQYFTPIGL